jgi:type I restriction enzyme S subunit
MKSKWLLVKASDLIEFNPRESLPKNTLAKKVAMGKLQPFTRDIPDYEFAPFNGGSKFRNGDTLMARITPCLENGKTAQVNLLNEDEVGFGSTEFIVLRARQNSSDKDYIYYLSLSPILRDVVIQSMIGSSGRQRVQQGVLNEIEFYAPPLTEQIKIGRTLKVIDDKITLNNRINDYLEQTARAIFAEKLGSTLYPIAGAPVEQIGNHLRFVNGFAFKSSTYLESGKYKVITIKNVQDGSVDSTGASCLNTLPTGLSSSCILIFGDVLLSLTGNVGRVGIVTEENLLLNQRVAKFDPVDKKFLPFWYFLFRRDEMKGLLINIAKGTAQQNLSPVETLKTEIAFNSELISEYIEAIAPMFWAIAENKKDSAHLAAIRDTLLPKLMSGELSVVDV